MGRQLKPLLFLSLLAFSLPVWAVNEAMQSFTLSGPVYQAGTTAPLLDSNLTVKVQILNPAKTCVLYEEQQTYDTSVTGGTFNVQVGSSFPNAKRTGGDPGNSMALIYQNIAAIPGTNTPSQTCGGSYTPATGATRYFRVTFTPSSTGIPDTMNPDIAMGSVPSAVVAQSLQGLERAAVLQVRSDASYSLNQANLESAFSAVSFPRLQALLSGTSAQYIPAMPAVAVSFNNQRLSSVGDPTSAQDVATKSYVDTYLAGKSADMSGVGAGIGNGKTLIWDSAMNKWVAATAPAAGTGTVTAIHMGTGLTGGTITTAGTVSVDVGTTANKIVRLNGSAQLPALDGSLLTNINSSRLGSRAVSAALPSAGQVLTWSGSVWEPQTVSGGSSPYAFVQAGNSFGAAAVLGTLDAYALSFKTNNSTAMTIAVGGRVGIGTTTPASGAVLDIVSLGSSASAIVLPRDSTAARPASATNGMARYNTTTAKMEFYENGSWVSFTASSDARLKRDVANVEGALEMIERMRPVYFNWDFANPKAQGYADRHQLGFIAQELEEVVPEVVNVGGDGYRTVEYGKIVAIAIAAAKELKGQVKTLRLENAELKTRLEKQSQDLEAIKRHLDMPR